jgi:CO/xanthine dehydrogenase Mo-binding subunit
VREAAGRIRDLIVGAAADRLEVPRDRIGLAHRRVYDLADPSRSMPFAEAAVLAESAHGTLVSVGSYTPPKGLGGDYKGAGVGPSPAYSYQAAVAEVSIDLETGVVTVDRITTAHDCGRAINPPSVEGQIEGSAYMAYGEAMVEEQVFRGGLHKKPSLLEYKLPTSLDTPELRSIIVETVDAEGPFGAKEAGEGPINPVIPAIANAVYDAIGVRFDETPITPAKVLDALQKNRARVGPDGLGSLKDPKASLRRLAATRSASPPKPSRVAGDRPDYVRHPVSRGPSAGRPSDVGPDA